MQLLEMKWTDVAKLSRDIPVVIPIAALEQHGSHMPVFTDSLLLGEVMRRVCEPLRGGCCSRHCSGWAIHIIIWTFPGRFRPHHASIWTC